MRRIAERLLCISLQRLAVLAHLDAIVTRDPKSFVGSPVPALTPAQLLALIPDGDRKWFIRQRRAQDEPEGCVRNGSFRRRSPDPGVSENEGLCGNATPRSYGVDLTTCRHGPRFGCF
jgi:hypothetical protein